MTRREIRQFRSSLRRFQRLASSQMRECCGGITLAQCLVLVEVEEIGQPTMGQLASRLRLDNSTLSRTVDGLVSGGLLERLRSDGDRRVVRIGLTSQGAKSCRSIHEENDAYCRAVFAKIPASRRAGVIKNFETLVGAYLDFETESNPDLCCDTAESNEATAKNRRSGRGARRLRGEPA